MTGLLVSVRDPVGAQAALRGGASLIDVKEPLHGSLGSASPEVWRQVRDAMPRQVPCSAALGELADVTYEQVSHWHARLAGYQYAKLGLAGCGEISNWQKRWQTVLHELPSETHPVAVVYADWQSAGAPSPDRILSAAISLMYFSFQELKHFLSAARFANLITVLAGSLTPALIRELLPLEPDFLAVRGAVCRGGRTGTVEESLVADLVQMLLSTRDGANHFSTPAKGPFAA